MLYSSRDMPGLQMPSTDARSRGFTLIEVMIVVAILGLLLAMAMPGMKRVRENAQNSRFASDLNVARSAFLEYSFFNGTYPPDVTPGIMPQGMEDYLLRMRWNKRTSVGGQWDWDYQQFGTRAGVSVYQPTADATQLQRLDEMIDDGNLNTGIFRARSAGYISVIE